MILLPKRLLAWLDEFACGSLVLREPALTGFHALGTQDEYSQDALTSLAILRRKGKRYNRLVLLLRAKIWALRICMRLDKPILLPTPNIAALRWIGNADMLALYREIKAATVVFGRTYGEDTEHELASLL